MATSTGIRRTEQLQALERGLQVLSYLNRVGVSSSGAVAKRFGLKASTAHRMLMVLSGMGMLRHDVLAHQFFLASQVRTLAASFREATYIDEIAMPLMQAWTRRHGVRLVLVADDAGDLTVLAATAGPWPLAQELVVAGSTLGETGSSEAAILFGTSGETRARSASTSSDAILQRGYALRTLTVERETHISVLMAIDGFRGALSMRCPTELLRSGKAVRHWAVGLRELAADTAAAIRLKARGD